MRKTLTLTVEEEERTGRRGSRTLERALSKEFSVVSVPLPALLVENSPSPAVHAPCCPGQEMCKRHFPSTSIQRKTQTSGRRAR